MSQLVTIIPKKVLKRWNDGADACAANWLSRMLELREILDEHRAKGERVIMQIYSEAAPSFRMSPKALQNKMLILREYPDAQLTRWIVQCGLSIDTIRAVNRGADNGEIKMTAVEYIENVVLNGGADGKVPTAEQVEQLIAEGTGKTMEYYFNTAARRLASKWGIADVQGFTSRLLALAREYGVKI